MSESSLAIRAASIMSDAAGSSLRRLLIAGVHRVIWMAKLPARSVVFASGDSLGVAVPSGDDIKFLASLRPEIPRLIALSRADQKPSEDIADILKGIRATLETRNLPFLDVVAVSARKKDWPFTPILEQLARWNGAPRALRFAHNFKHQFTRYSGHLDDERRQAQQHLNRMNRILGLSDEEAIQEDAQELKNKTNGQLQTAERLQSELGALRHRFFAELKLVGDHVGIAMPEPSALDLLDDVAGFNLLDALRQLREAEGKPAPDEPASLRELGQPGETPKIAAFLNG